MYLQNMEKKQRNLNILLDKYAEFGLEAIEDINTLKATPFSKIGTVTEIINKFDNKDNYLKAINELKTNFTRM